MLLMFPPSVSDSCGYTSGSESEVGDDSEPELGPNRRVRTKFTSYQIARLEKTFHKHKYLGASQRRKIAEKLHLSETQVRPSYIRSLIYYVIYKNPETHHLS